HHPRDSAIWGQVTAQVRRFLSELRSAGAFTSVPSDQAFLVICDERINVGEAGEGKAPPAVNILVQFAGLHAGAYHSFMITHSLGGSQVRQVVVNRLEASLHIVPELEQEVTIKLGHSHAS